MEPFRLAPVIVPKPWGGHRLMELGKHPLTQPIGESWEVADLPPEAAPSVEDPVSRVASGPWTGWSLGAVAARSGDLMGPASLSPDGRFPLLVKLLDAREHLSVQLHPHEDYVAEHNDVRLKTESWYVVEADPGAVLMLDVTGTDDDVRRAIGASSITAHLRQVSAGQGAFHHVPAGMIHALGAGVMVAEFQTPSDTTFRVYDWTTEYDREPRRLHLAEAREAVITHHPERLDLAAMGAPGTRRLISTENYWMREHSAADAIGLGVEPGPRVVMCVAGRATLGDVELRLGDTAVVPASAMDTVVRLDGTLLEAGIPV